MAIETLPGYEIGNKPNQLLRGLFLRAEDKLTDAELRTLRHLNEEAESIVGNIAEVCNGLGNLVHNDTGGDVGVPAGDFRSCEDLSVLLWTLGGLASYAKGLINVASEAETTLEDRARRATRGARAA